MLSTWHNEKVYSEWGWIQGAIFRSWFGLFATTFYTVREFVLWADKIVGYVSESTAVYWEIYTQWASFFFLRLIIGCEIVGKTLARKISRLNAAVTIRVRIIRRFKFIFAYLKSVLPSILLYVTSFDEIMRFFQFFFFRSL